MNYAQFLGLIRHLLTIAGTVLVMFGKEVDGSNWQMLTGGVIALASLVWSIFSKTEPTTTLK